MNTLNGAAALLISLLVPMPQPASAQSNCSLQVEEVQRQLQAFERDARQMGPGFVSTAGVAGTSAGLIDLAARMKSWDVGIEGYRSCLSREGCSVADFVRAQEASNRDLARWLSSLGDEGLEQATRKAGRASVILRNFAAVAGTATTGPLAAAVTCLTETPPPSAPAPMKESSSQQAPIIDHRPVACAVAERFPRMEARFSPADIVAKAQVLFEGATAEEWYAVAMKPDSGGFSGILPKPKRSLKEFRYYIEVTDKVLRTSRTAEYTTSVVGSASECQGKVVAVTVASAAVALTGPAGAAVVPAGFAATGVVAAGSGVAGASGASASGGGLSTGVLVAGGLAAAAGGIAVAASSAKSSDTSSASTGTTAPSCPSASELAGTSGGTLTPVGSVVCTQFLPCTTGSARVCIQNWCSPTSCEIYYQTSSGAQSLCSTGCSSTNISGIQSCASSFVSRICQ
jgi:hypothetical protein